jgi:hypothetical protein
MRCISKPNDFSNGISAVRSGQTYLVCLDNDRSVAFVSAESFNAMVSRGHAIDEKPQVLQMDSCWLGILRTTLGGTLIFRCDFEIVDGKVWLIPEKPENKDSSDLLLLAREYDMGRNIEPTFTPGAEPLTSVYGRYNDRFHLVKLSPGSGIQFRAKESKSVPRHGLEKINPFHVEQFEEKECALYEVFLSEEDGALHC